MREVGDLAEYLFDLTEWASDLSHTPLAQEKIVARNQTVIIGNLTSAAAYRYAELMY